MSSKLDRNADTHERHRRNWQRLVEGSGTSLITADGTTISTSGGVLHVVAGGIGTAQLANGSVTFAKVQNIPTDSLVGRDTAGSGPPESIGVTGGIVFTGTGAIQTTAFTGDVTKGLGGTILTLATVGTAGTFNQVLVNAKGLVLSGTSNSYITGNQTITLSGDISGSGATAITTTLPNIATAGTFNVIAVNAKGQFLSGSNNTYTTTTVATDTIWSSKGDLAVGTGVNAAIRLGVGTASQTLVPKTSATSGIAWGYQLDTSSVTGFPRKTATNTNTLTTMVNSRAISSANVTSIAESTEPVHQVYHLLAAGVYSSATALDTLTFTFNVRGNGVTTAMATITLTMAGTESNVPFVLEGDAQWRTTGATGGATCWLRLTSGTTVTGQIVIPTSDTTVDTTGASNSFTLASQWSAARPGNTSTVVGERSLFISNGQAI